MGNSTSSARGHHDETVDFGFLYPQGVHTGTQDWNQEVVTHLIVQRKLAPFYRPLEDYDESWDDDQILAARKELPDSEHGQGESSSSRPELPSSRSHSKRPVSQKEIPRYPEAALYRGAMECPICFLYYPPNINHSRCCDQAICTECFVQIKRSEPTTTHLVSDPASCPYCVQENFGVVYTPPSWRAGIGSEGLTPPSWPDSPKSSVPSLKSSLASTRRRRSFGPDSPEVVTIDQIRPDWEAKLLNVRAAAQRRANRRIIMRQVGDRLIPVGVTSGRLHALGADEMENAEANGSSLGSRRFRRRPQNPDLQQMLGQVGMGGQDLEEMMIMEAMRLSLIDHEDQQRRQREEEVRNQRNDQNDEADHTSMEGSSLSAPQSLSFLSTSTPTSSNFDNRSSHRSSVSMSAAAPDTIWRNRRTSPPPFSAYTGASLVPSMPTSFLEPQDDITGTGSLEFATSSGPTTPHSGPVAIPSDDADLGSPLSAPTEGSVSSSYNVPTPSPESPSSAHYPLMG